MPGKWFRARGLFRFALWVLLGVLGSGAAQAQTEPVELAGTLQHAQATGKVAIGYRTSSIPFSYVATGATPIGYSIDLCTAIVDAMADEVGRALSITWVPVTSESRTSAIQSGSVDLECGSTTNNAERRAVVAFSPIIFVSGTRLMVKRNSPIKSFRDLAGKTVVVTAGTTNEAALRKVAAKFGIAMNIVVAPDHAESYAMVETGKVDAFATDEALLYGFIAKNNAHAELDVVGEFLSYEPYGIMFRKGDDQLKALIDKVFAQMAEADDFSHIYDRWFMQRLPSGEHINLPMSPQLVDLFASYGSKPE